MGFFITVPKERKPKLADAERHKHFVETARRVEVPQDQNGFDNAFKFVASSKKSSRSS
jgi:hypothetical protein